jgi:hypothetical protein
MRPLSESEARTFLEEERGDRFEPLYYVLAITTGLRRGELLGLRWNDADLGEVGGTFRLFAWVAAQSLSNYLRTLLVLNVLPAKSHLFRVEPRGFEPLTSAVQRRPHRDIRTNRGNGLCRSAV